MENNLLIICQDITASQPVWDFIQALRISNKSFTVICNNIKDGLLKDNIISMNCSPNYSPPISKLGVILFKKDYSYISYEKKILNYCLNKINENTYQKILVFTSGDSYNCLNAGYNLSVKKKLPLWIHTVDPLPSIPAWGEKNIYRKAIIKMIKPYFKRADFFSANNETLLEYQSDLMNYKGKREFIPTIMVEEFKLFEEVNKPIFLYAGSFYGKRTPDQLINGFIEYLAINKDAELVIAGFNNINLDDYNIKPNQKKQIKLLGFVEDFDTLFKKASVLIDIDANVPNDVFISGKLVKYLNTSKIIFSITPDKSPTRNWLNSIQGSCSVANYNINEIKNGFIESYQLSKSLKNKDVFEIREKILRQFSTSYVMSKINKNFNF